MQYINVDIRPMKITDLDAVLEIENLTFVSPWSKEAYISELNDNKFANLWVIELSTDSNNKTVVGFCDFWITFDSASIAKIAVHPDIQRRQLGTAMMDEIINECYAKKVRNITLEVRKSNVKAHSFYIKQGFKDNLIKPNYYSNGEDAIYMTFEVNK